MPRIGAHLPVGRGLVKTAQEARNQGLEALQIFVRNPRGAAARQLKPEEVRGFRQIIEEANIDPVVVHVPYICNPASVRPDLYELAERVIREDLERCDLIGARYLVLHPGSATGSTPGESLERLAALLDRVLAAYQGSARLLLETMAGQGSEIGRNFPQLATVYDRCSSAGKLGICFDTCHTYAAGYDVQSATGIERVVQELEDTFGPRAVKVVHVNDSAHGLNSHRDRHAPIGEGVLGEATFTRLLRHPYFHDLPFVLETPLETLSRDVEILKRLRG